MWREDYVKGVLDESEQILEDLQKKLETPDPKDDNANINAQAVPSEWENYQTKINKYIF